MWVKFKSYENGGQKDRFDVQKGGRIQLQKGVKTAEHTST